MAESKIIDIHLEPLPKKYHTIWCDVCGLILPEENLPHYLVDININGESRAMIPNFCPRCGKKKWNFEVN